MRLTMGEAAALLLIALPNLISALPVNTGANLEQLVPLTSVGKRAAELEILVPVTQFKRDAESLTSWTLDQEKRSNGEVEVLVPVVGRDLEKLVPVISGHSKRELEKLVPVTPRNVGELEERKTIPPMDQLDPGSMAPDAITTVEKRKTIPPADQLDPGSVSPDSIKNNEKRQEYAHTATVIATVLETVTGGVGIPGYPATAISEITSVHVSTVTHLPSTVTAVVTAGASSSIDTTCTESTTSTGIGSVVTTTPLSSSTKAAIATTTPTGVKTRVTSVPIISNGGTSTNESSKASGTIASKVAPSGSGKATSETGAFGTAKNGTHPVATGSFRLSGTGDVSSKTSITSTKPSASGSLTTIVDSSTTRIYTTVNASGSGSGSSSKATASAKSSIKATNGGTSTSVVAAGPTEVKSSSSSGVKLISTSTSTSAIRSSTHPASVTSSSKGASVTSSAHTSIATSAKATPSSVKASSTLATSVKPSSTKAAAPAMTSKIVYSGVQKVEPFKV
ncbi:uncharacterized protein EAF02_004083 [Botrytis sinoallii]|uniref:uncharacterized protein n=1 Tax=Botrytis sinoallii TaxID=1463999 RepID=UPI0019023572|nr:uncharacterized protein EAF02_004083 [Botrytis sinoallii]KAF7885574.1 hypothetical protein EAF02_004083 [Botrytis sinoallii]